MTTGTMCTPSFSRDPQRLARLKQIVTDDAMRSGLPIVAVYVHGSWGTRDERPDSDLDMAVLTARSLTLEEHLDFVRHIELATGAAHQIDMADISHANSVFAALVITNGDRIYSKGSEADRFEMKVLASYARLNEERKGILEDIIKRGTVYNFEPRVIA